LGGNLQKINFELVERAIDDACIVAVTDKHGTITYVNKKFCEISKYQEEELLGQNHRMLKSGYHSSAFYIGLWKTISAGHTWKGEIKNKAKDGTFYWVFTVIIPMFDEAGQIQSYISIRTDITELKSLQEKMQRLEKITTIGKLSARLSHDLRNPLSVIKNAIMMLKMMQQNCLDEKSSRHFHRIENAISRMTHQINDVLEFVKSSPLKLSNCSLIQILQEVSMAHSYENVKINLPQNDVTILCDPDKMYRVFTNLILNAIQAIDLDKGEITIRIMEKENEILVEVEDTGPGIREEFLSRMFEPLFTTKQTGTGLGLVSCLSIVQGHGGTIEVTSTLGKCTTFIIKLPKHTKTM